MTALPIDAIVPIKYEGECAVGHWVGGTKSLPTRCLRTTEDGKPCTAPVRPIKRRSK
jgi:hypothetical protein